MSKTNHHLMPEYWVTCHIARAFAQKGLTVQCEKRIWDLISGGGSGRIDLVVYCATGQNPASPRALIEVKGERSGWPTFPGDFIRLMTIAQMLPSVTLIGLLYATGPGPTSNLKKEEELLKQIFSKPPLGQTPHFYGRNNSNYGNLGDVWEVMSIFDHVRQHPAQILPNP